MSVLFVLGYWFMKKILGIVVLGLLLSGNAYAAPQDGTGDLKLSLNVIKNFQDYIRGGVSQGAKSSNNKPMVFYVTLSGSRSFWWYCPYGQCQSGAHADNMRSCKKGTGEDCLRFARKKTVKWKNGINPGKGKESKFHERMSNEEMLAKLTKLGFYGNENSSSNAKITKKKKETKSSNLIKEIKELKKLFDDNILTEEEFIAAKKKLLN